MLQEKEFCEYADIGDSDGSVRLLLKKYFNSQQLSTVGINLQTQAVEKMKKSGLNAICEDALNLKAKGIQYDIASVFETLEHLPAPINFLMDIRDVVRHKLVISVPFIRRSRVSLSYLTDRWDHSRRPTIENVHIFELSPADWSKIFLHTGWQIDREKKLMMFPSNKPSRVILQPYWFYTSFEGFWFVTLSKCDKFSSRYTVE
jgi:2-polyprenyl-3-methyl-5-hydroxy-6-metoxy-1,4-benzoquinol methylase